MGIGLFAQNDVAGCPTLYAIASLLIQIRHAAALEQVVKTCGKRFVAIIVVDAATGKNIS